MKPVRLLPLLPALLLGICTPMQAATQVDIETLARAIRSTGTKIVDKNDCEKGNLGFYEFEAKKLDQMTLCVNNLDMNDTDQVWEIYAHEVTHIMQACQSGEGGRAFDDSYFPRIYRELRDLHPSSIEDMELYGSWDKRQEIEARWMELQPPRDVINFFLDSLCFKQE